MTHNMPIVIEALKRMYAYIFVIYQNWAQIFLVFDVWRRNLLTFMQILDTC